MSERYYVNLPLTIGPFTLDGPEAHHLASVCRLRAGDPVCLFNGDGREYPARILSAGRREIALEILGIAEPQRELPCTLVIAAPMPKGDRGQFLIEKLTELGVKRFVPLACARSNLHPREVKRDKLLRYVIEASKQCGRNVLMQVEEVTDWASYCVQGDAAEVRILAHPDGTANWENLVTAPESTIHLAVGPEGGFTDDEVALATHNGWRSLTLGPRILRIETAAIVLATRAIGGMMSRGCGQG